MTKKRQTSITLENIGKLLDTKLGSKFSDFEKRPDSKLNSRFNEFEKYFDQKTDETKEDLRSEIKHLPTREEYFAREDKTMRELKKLRDEVAATGNLYEKTNKRIDKVDKHLGIDTSVVF